jgi:predicted RNA methylase
MSKSTTDKELQSKGLKRDAIDKFYTNVNYANKCIMTIKTHLEINYQDLIIEPSAGNGSFILGIKELTCNNLFYDIDPENNEILKQDYLLLDLHQFKDKMIHVIGNPPFGRQSSTAIKFIKKSAEFANSISFILPKSFKKESMKSKFPLEFHLIFEEDVPSYSFLVNEKEYDVPCVLQIWKKYDEKRLQQIKQVPVGFEFVKIFETPDISFRRVGVYAGKIDIGVNKSEQSHYFIKFTNNKSIEENLLNLKKIKFKDNNTVGPKSISKQELIEEFIKFL